MVRNITQVCTTVILTPFSMSTGYVFMNAKGGVYTGRKIYINTITADKNMYNIKQVA